MEHEALEQGGHLVHLIVGLVFALLLLSAAIQALTKRIKIPFTVALVLVGILLAQLANLELGFFWFLGPVQNFRLPPEVVLFVFLPTSYRRR